MELWVYAITNAQRLWDCPKKGEGNHLSAFGHHWWPETIADYYHYDFTFFYQKIMIPHNLIYNDQDYRYQ